VLEEHALSGAGGPDDGKGLAVGDRQIQFVEDDEPAEALGDFL
jgi:hypothetical protein